MTQPLLSLRSVSKIFQLGDREVRAAGQVGVEAEDRDPDGEPDPERRLEHADDELREQEHHG